MDDEWPAAGRIRAIEGVVPEDESRRALPMVRAAEISILMGEVYDVVLDEQVVRLAVVPSEYAPAVQVAAECSHRISVICKSVLVDDSVHWAVNSDRLAVVILERVPMDLQDVQDRCATQPN